MTVATTPKAVDQLRLDEGTPLQAARRIARLAKQRKVHLSPGLYLRASGVGMACFVGFLSVELYREMNQLDLDNGELVASLILSMDPENYVDHEYRRDDLIHPLSVKPESTDGDDLRVFIADHTARLSLEDIEQIEQGFENEMHIESGYTYSVGFAEDIRPSKMRGDERRAWRELPRTVQIGYYLRLIANKVMA